MLENPRNMAAGLRQTEWSEEAGQKPSIFYNLDSKDTITCIRSYWLHKPGFSSMGDHIRMWIPGAIIIRDCLESWFQTQLLQIFMAFPYGQLKCKQKCLGQGPSSISFLPQHLSLFVCFLHSHLLQPDPQSLSPALFLFRSFMLCYQIMPEIFITERRKENNFPWDQSFKVSV